MGAAVLEDICTGVYLCPVQICLHLYRLVAPPRINVRLAHLYWAEPPPRTNVPSQGRVGASSSPPDTNAIICAGGKYLVQMKNQPRDKCPILS
jgi:hypothetical protein